MRLADWLVLCGSLAFVVLYGLWRGRGSNSVNKYLLAGKTMPWYAMALSIMATQASAVTFISTTGQSYVDGMRFVQFYFGLPLAMVILAVTAVPIFHRANVYTAYEYLEQRFDTRTRALVSVIFLIQRGLALGITLYAPAVVLTVILGWPVQWTTLIMGAVAVLYTTLGGVKTVAWSDFQQMLVMTAGLVAALVAAVLLLPRSVSFLDAVTLAGAAGRLNAVTLNLDWNDRYNLWSGLIGGMFLALAYFGCDQSQVQRYLTGKSIAQSRLSLLFNGMAKVPMQFFILFIGAMVFVFYIYEKPPLLFQRTELARIQEPSLRAEYQPLEQRYDAAFESRRAAADRLIQARRSGDTGLRQEGVREFSSAQRDLDEARRQERSPGGEGRGHQGTGRHQLHLPHFRHPPPAGGPGGAGARGHFRGDHGVHFGRDQFAGNGEHDRPLQAAFPQERHGSSLSERFARRHGVLGLLRRRHGEVCRKPGLAGRSGQRAGILFLWRHARCVRARVLLPARAGARRVLRRAGRGGRDFCRLLLHEDRLPLVQRDRLPGGGRHRHADFAP